MTTPSLRSGMDENESVDFLEVWQWISWRKEEPQGPTWMGEDSVWRKGEREGGREGGGSVSGLKNREVTPS